MTCPTLRCPGCDDRVIHQNNRQSDEAASGILQMIHGLPHQMDVIDDDLEPDAFDVVKQKLDPPLWRRIEHKPIGTSLRDSQRFLLPRLANSIAAGVNMKNYHPASGVFVVWSDLPYQSGTVAEVRPSEPLTLRQEIKLEGREWYGFWTVSKDEINRVLLSRYGRTA